MGFSFIVTSISLRYHYVTPMLRVSYLCVICSSYRMQVTLIITTKLLLTEYYQSS
jgi:hypothetical protein